MSTIKNTANTALSTALSSSSSALGAQEKKVLDSLPPSLGVGGAIRTAIDKMRSSSLSNTQAKQLEQIEQGVANGTISEKEAAGLLKQQAAISNAMKVAQSDGFISAADQKAIAQAQSQAGAGIKQANQSNELDSLFQDPGVTQKQAGQIGEIAKGIRSGELSGAEASKLLGGQADIAQNAAKAENSIGQMSDKDVSKLSQQQAAAGRDIAQQSHDFDKAPHGKPSFPFPLPHLPIHTQPGNPGIVPPHQNPNPGIVPPHQTAPGNPGIVPPHQTAPGNPGIVPPHQTAPGNPGIVPPHQTAPGNPGIVPPHQTAPGNTGIMPPHLPIFRPPHLPVDPLQAGAAKLANAQSDQLKQIQDGVANGTISEKEASKLLKQQAKLSEAMTRAQSDHKLSPKEMAVLQKQQAKAAADIKKASASNEVSSLFQDQGVTQAQAAQIGKIAQGIRSGELSGAEASRALNTQSHIAHDAAKSENGIGQMSDKSVSQLSKEQADAGKALQKDLHNSTKGAQAPHPHHHQPTLKSNSAELGKMQGEMVNKIAQGLANGTISEKAAAEMMKQQSALSEAVKRAESDGKLSPKEMKALRQQFNKVSEGIPHHQPSALESALRKPVSADVQAQVEQLRNIAQGLRNGQVSGGEASKLLAEQAGISKQISTPGQGVIGGFLHDAEVAMAQAKAGLNILEDKTNTEKAPHAAAPLRPPFILG